MATGAGGRRGAGPGLADRGGGAGQGLDRDAQRSGWPRPAAVAAAAVLNSRPRARPRTACGGPHLLVGCPADHGVFFGPVQPLLAGRARLTRAGIVDRAAGPRTAWSRCAGRPAVLVPPRRGAAADWGRAPRGRLASAGPTAVLHLDAPPRGSTAGFRRRRPVRELVVERPPPRGLFLRLTGGVAGARPPGRPPPPGPPP